MSAILTCDRYLTFVEAVGESSLLVRVMEEGILM